MKAGKDHIKSHAYLKSIVIFVSRKRLTISYISGLDLEAISTHAEGIFDGR